MDGPPGQRRPNGRRRSGSPGRFFGSGRGRFLGGGRLGSLGAGDLGVWRRSDRRRGPVALGASLFARLGVVGLGFRLALSHRLAPRAVVFLSVQPLQLDGHVFVD